MFADSRSSIFHGARKTHLVRLRRTFSIKLKYLSNAHREKILENIRISLEEECCSELHSLITWLEIDNFSILQHLSF